MTQETILDRRKFMRSASVALGGTVAWPVGLSTSATASPSRSQPRLAIVGSMGAASSIRLYQVLGNGWKLLQDIPSRAPVSLLLHPNQKTLYILNQIEEHEGLPRGTVEVYRLNHGTAELKFLCRQPLSLSAIKPRQMSLSPDGATLAIAIAGGGSYNVLPVQSDGTLGRVSSVRKETGSGPLYGQESSHPQNVCFAPAGNAMISTDLGCDRISVFSIAPGIELAARLQLPAGIGPRHLVFYTAVRPSKHPAGDLLFVDYALEGAISAFRLNGSVLTPLPETTTRGSFGDALALGPSGGFLCAAGRGSLGVWRIDPLTGRIRLLQSNAVGPVSGLTFHPDGSTLYATTPEGILQFDMAASSSFLGNPHPVTLIPNAHSVLFV